MAGAPPPHRLRGPSSERPLMWCDGCGRVTREARTVCRACERERLGMWRKRTCRYCGVEFLHRRLGRPAMYCPEHRVSWVYKRAQRGAA